LREVPGDAAPDHAGLLRAHPLPQRVRGGAVDVDLREQREAHVVGGGADLLRLLIGPGILVELVRREAEHREAVLGVRVAQLLQAHQLRGEGALGGDVHDEDQTPAVLTHLPVLTVDGECGEVVEALLVHGLLARLGSDVRLHRRARSWARAGTVLPGRPAQARKSSTSARVRALSVPRRVTAIAAAAFARVAAASQSAPRARSASSTPVCVSPAPLVSTGVIGNAGISVPRPWWNTRQPRSPSRTTTTAPERRCRRI